MKNWWNVLHEGQKDGWMSYNALAACVPEKTPTLELVDCINLAKSLGIQMVSNVESKSVLENIQDMCELQDIEDQLIALDEDADGETEE